MRPKMISLCPTSHEIAQKMPNFSAWVRQQLLRLALDEANWDLTPQEVKQNELTAKYLPCPNCETPGDHWCLPLQMRVKGWLK